MSTYPVLDEIARVQERNRADYEALAQMTGRTVAEIEADTCAPDQDDICLKCGATATGGLSKDGLCFECYCKGFRRQPPRWSGT